MQSGFVIRTQQAVLNFKQIVSEFYVIYSKRPIKDFLFQNK